MPKDHYELPPPTDEEIAAHQELTAQEAFDRLSFYRPAGLGQLIKETREQSRLALRELARRSGVSAGQLSRIENGQVAQPAEETLQRLAAALNRDHRPLEFLADRLPFADLCTGVSALFADIYDRGEQSEWANAVAGAQWAVRQAEGLDDPDERQIRMWEAGASLARLWFDHKVYGNVPAELLTVSADPDLREIAEAWPALTDERKRLVRLLVADQVFISDRERRGGAAVARIEIDFADRGER